MDKSRLQEDLATLYLRLNGYFTSGFVVHSPAREKRANRTQVDALAVRFPHNSEPEREVEPSEYLQISGQRIDLLVCEVKGGQQRLQFNEALRNDPKAVRSVLRWIGLLRAEEVENLIAPVSEILRPRAQNAPDEFPCLEHPDQPYRIRGILFAPDRSAPKPNQIRYVHGNEIVGYIWRCVQSAAKRAECSVRYDFGLWGPYEEIVRFFKEKREKPALSALYNTLAPS